ncbi:MAG: glycosyltransferase family 4 protein [Lachnospiraceae bacterium]|nr:glycosyltransferase family 4 protein [Lachnospiraceae bacterium]
MYKIIYFLDYGESYGGAVHTLLEQAKLVRAAGNSIQIFISDYHGNTLDEGYRQVLTNRNIEVHSACFQLSSQPEDIDLICLSDFYEEVKARVQAYSPDLIHSVQLNPMAELISRELDIPHIMNIYPLSKDFFKIKYMNIFAHYHICDSVYWAKQWQEFWHTDYACIRTAVANAPLKKKNRFSNELNCLCVGSIYAGKNQLEVIKGFHKALLVGFHGKLLLYGYAEGAYASQCKNYIIENQLSSNIFIMGFQSDMASVYQNGDILICGSCRESYPNVISEAMTNGLIVLSTPVGGIPEVIRDGENGYLTEGIQADSIANGLIRIMEDIHKGRAEDIRNQGYVASEQHHSPAIIREEIINYYRYVIQDYKYFKSKERPTITEVLRQYSPIIDFFKQNRNLFSEERQVALKLWYICSINDKINKAILQKKAFYVWGTGKLSRSVLEMLSAFWDNIVVKGMIDSNRQGTYDKYIIYRPEEVLSQENIIVILALYNGQWDVVSVLEKYQKVYLEDYFILTARAW